MTAPDSTWLRPLVDLALIISTLELLWLLVRALRRTGARQVVPPLLANLGAGLLLMLALRLALHGTAAVAIAVCVAGAGLAHLLDLHWRRA